MKEENKGMKKPHINLKPLEGTRIRGIGFAVTEPFGKPISDKEFVNRINSVINTSSFKLNSKTNTYFLLELTVPYYSKEVSHLLNKLKLKTKSVLGDFKLLVATEPEILTSYLRGKIHKGILNVIKDIKQLESSLKIGKSLQNIIREDVDKKKAVNILIRLLNNLEDEERMACLKELSSILSSQREINFHQRSLTVSCVCGTSTIKKLADLPFIKIITESPKIQDVHPKDEDSQLIYPMEEIAFVERETNLPPICIIDSGISPLLDKFVIKKDLLYNFFSLTENVPHGTSVASVAIFGEDLLERKKVLENKTKVISLKIDDASISTEDINLEESIMEAVKRYKALTPIFNLSYNYEDIPDESRIEMIKKLDYFIQKENVILVNSSGNISMDKSYLLRDKYPKYLSQHNVYSPAEARNIFSVGSICNTSSPNKIIHSNHTRLGIPPLYQNGELDKFIFFKPEINTYGGNSIPDEKARKNVITKDLGFPVLAPNGSIICSAGTSFSAPLISLCFARLYGKFGKVLKNSETYKAILLNQSKYSECDGFTTFSILDTKHVGECTDAIYLNFEGESEPHEKAENQKRKQLIKCKKIKFYVPAEAESIDAVIVHSNNYADQDPSEFKTKVILKLVKPSGTPLKKEYGNIGKNSAVTYAKYKLGRNYAGEWDAELHIETTGIPKELFDQIRVRFGVSLKINLKEEYSSNLDELYDEVLQRSRTTESIVQKELISIKEAPIRIHNQIAIENKAEQILVAH